MKPDKKLYDAYYSYRMRRMKKGVPYPTLDEYVELKQKSEKTKDGKMKTEWMTEGSRPPLIWNSKYSDIKSLKKREREILAKLENKIPHKSRPGELRKQLERVREAIEILEEINSSND